MSRQFNTQNYPKPRFKVVYLNFLDNQGHYDFRGVVQNQNGVILQPANPQDFYMAQIVGINYAYLGGIIHECNYDLQTTSLTNGKQYTFSLGKVIAMRKQKDDDPVRVEVFDYAKAAFKVCYNSTGWGGDNSQPTMLGLSPITSITVRFAGSPFNPQVHINTVYSDLVASGNIGSCNRLNWKEYEQQEPNQQDPAQSIVDQMRYESWGSPGVGFAPSAFEYMIISLFDNQTTPRQTIDGQSAINVPIAAVQYIYQLGTTQVPAFNFTGTKSAPLAYFIEEDVDPSSPTYGLYRFNMIRSCEEAFNVEGIFDGEYRELECRSLIRASNDNTIDGHDESAYNIRRFDSYPETTRLVGYTDSH